MKRPQTESGLYAATPNSAIGFNLLGGSTYLGVAFTNDEMQGLERAYGFELQRETHPLLHAGSSRNLLRQVQIDGLRVMALLSRYLEAGEDPVQLVAHGLMESDFDVELEEDSD